MSIILNAERAWLQETYSFHLVSEMRKNLTAQRHNVGRGWCWGKEECQMDLLVLLWVLRKFHRNSSIISTWPVPFVSMPWKSPNDSGPFRLLERWCTVWLTAETVGTQDWTPSAQPLEDFPFWSFNRCHQPRRGDFWHTRGFLLPEAHWPASVKGPNLSVGKEF